MSVAPVAQTKPVPATCWAFGEGVWTDLKSRRVYLCPPGTVASVLTKEFKTQNIAAGGMREAEARAGLSPGAGAGVGGWPGKVTFGPGLRVRRGSPQAGRPLEGWGKRCSNRQTTPKLEECLLALCSRWRHPLPDPLLFLRVLIRELFLTHGTQTVLPPMSILKITV